MASSNHGIVTVLLRNAENRRLRDVRTIVEFYRGDGRKLQGFIRHFENHREDFRLDAFPLLPKRVDVKPVRYKRVASFFRVKPGERLLVDVPCFRDRNANWRARFARWGDLGSGHNDLKRMLASSPKLELKIRNPSQIRPLGLFTRLTYDDVDDQHLIEGKAGLLNVYSKMFHSGVKGVAGRPWMRGVQEILRIQRDRIVALIDEDTAKLIRKLEQNKGADRHYRGDRNNLDGHRKNIPEQFTIEEMHSVKTRDEVGVLQLTVAFAREANQKRYVLDADIDEHGKLLLHFGDFLRHRITRYGTHPYEVHDLLHHSIKKLNLEYHLV
jgi:hypothetical protein